MLANLDDPMTRATFAAARAQDAVLLAARDMTVAGSRRRAILRDGCASDFAELRRFARDHFADRRAIPPAIEALERAVAELAALPVPELIPSARFRCPVCRSRLERRGQYGIWAPFRPTHVYCGWCLRAVIPALRALQTWQGGFGTEDI